ncbi:MAG: hypothetical protein QOD03_1088 [Verrucomicrobiota bacterium]|jgi:hypothetical protein
MRTFLIFLCLGLVGCASSSVKSVRVDYSDGVNEREATIIADEYLQEHMSASFGHTGPYDSGAAWTFRITGDVVPFELTNVPPVIVAKSTGVVTWEAKPPLKK